MTKILAIGNSFSQDATKYLHPLSNCAGTDTKIVNLCIGGCSLSRHWENAEKDIGDYGYEVNGEDTGLKVSLKQALLKDNWDFITLQQASCDSGVFETFFPYAFNLLDYINEFSPDSKKMLHQTWAYETDCQLEAFARYDNNQIMMYNALKSSYEKASSLLNLDLIPCGDVIQRLRETAEFDYANGGKLLCRDGFHMHLIWGRYTLAATWFESVLQGNILNNDFIPPDMGEDESCGLLNIIKKIVHQICSDYYN